MKPAVITITLNPSLDKTVILDHLVVGGLNRVQQVRIDPGGKGINVAKLLKNFDIEVLVTGLAGGEEGNGLIGFLEQAQIQCDFMKINGRTRTNLKIVDIEKRITTEINEAGADITAEELQLFLEQMPARLNDASYLVLGGSIPPGVDNSIYFNLIEMANSKGIKTVLDADGEAFRQALKAIPYAIKPNIHELEEFYGRTLKSDNEIVSAGQEILNTGVSVVMVSMGEQGAIIMNQKFLFGSAMIASGNYTIMGPIAVAICIPPIGMGLATLLNKKKFEVAEQEAGKAALFMGLFGITEGAIPFAAKDPLRVIPSIMAGSMVGAVIAMIAHVGDHVPHGGLIVAALGAVDNVVMFFTAILVGMFVTALIANTLKKNVV
jgi:1-phosphofructokinase